MSIELAELLAPISPDRPCGEDVSFSDVYDRVREARRADDPSLRQGEWQTELKVADWRLVIRLATEVLTRQSKDLQMAVWLGEALIATDGVGGATQSADLLYGLLDTMWDGLYPELDGDDAEERAAKLAWYNIYASDALRRVPLSGGARPMTLLDWQDSREVDNLARQNQESHRAALDEGRLRHHRIPAGVRNPAAADPGRHPDRVAAPGGCPGDGDAAGRRAGRDPGCLRGFVGCATGCIRGLCSADAKRGDHRIARGGWPRSWWQRHRGAVGNGRVPCSAVRCETAREACIDDGRRRAASIGQSPARAGVHR